MTSIPTTQRVVKWYPPAYDIRVEVAPVPKIEHPDDAIIKIQLAGLCGSDLHIYRGHEDVDAPLICGHEFIGTVVELGDNFHDLQSSGRPTLYSTLCVGDKVVSPFTVSCGECHFCRVGFTCRCVHSILFGIPALPGGQAQYIRVPKAGGTLFKASDFLGSSQDSPHISDSSLLLLADILPTGVFAACQALQHMKQSPMVTGTPYPFCGFLPKDTDLHFTSQIRLDDRHLTIAIIGLGPVGICAAVSLLDMLDRLHESQGTEYRVIAIDPLASRREKLTAILLKTHGKKHREERVVVADIPTAKGIVKQWTKSSGCNSVLEIVGNNSALTLAYDLVRPFGSISSVGVHQEPQLPFTGRDMYNKNISFDFGRCPVRAMLPIAATILHKYQVVFGGIGEDASLIDRIVSFDDAVEYYSLFDKGLCGKILFDPWQ